MKPRVTEILKATGWIDTTWYTAAGRDRGTAIHEATEAMDTLGLPPSTWPEYEKKLDTWASWKTDNQVEIVTIEQAVEHAEYIGRCDRVVKAPGGVYVLDIKSGSKQPWHKVQIAAYATALGLDQGIIIYLGMGKRGREVIVDFDMPEYKDVWAKTLAEYKELVKYGV